MHHAVSHAPPLLFLFQVVDMCAVMFWRLVSRHPCFSFDSSQLTAVLCRVKERVVKVCKPNQTLNCKPNMHFSVCPCLCLTHT